MHVATEETSATHTSWKVRARSLYEQTRDDNFSLGCNSASERGALIPPSAANQRPGTFNQDSHFLFISFAIHFSGCTPARLFIWPPARSRFC